MAATDSKPNDTTQPMCWPASLFRLVELGERPDDRLALCTPHHGAHVRCSDPRDGTSWCQDLDRPKTPWRPRRMAAGAPEPAPLVVQLDAAQLGRVISEGVVDGFRRARAEQKAESQT